MTATLDRLIHPRATRQRTGDGAPDGALGLTSSTALVIGSIIGTGVFTMPAVMAGAGTSSIITLGVIAVGAVLLGLHVRPAHQAGPEHRRRPLRLHPPRVRRLRRLPDRVVLLDHLLGRQRRDRRRRGSSTSSRCSASTTPRPGPTSASPSPACGSRPSINLAGVRQMAWFQNVTRRAEVRAAAGRRRRRLVLRRHRQLRPVQRLAAAASTTPSASPPGSPSSPSSASSAPPSPPAGSRIPAATSAGPR